MLFIAGMAFVLIVLHSVTFAVFSDVPSDNANYDAINYVQDQGIVSGYPDGTYKPENQINRAEFTKIIIGAQFSEGEINDCLYKNTKLDDETVFFKDVPITAWFAKYVCIAKIYNVVSGYPDGTFGPANNINFAEAAKIIVKAFNYQVGTDSIWYKPYVEKLGEKKAIPTTIESFGYNITRGEMAEMIWRLKANITNLDSYTYADLAGSVSTSGGTPVKLSGQTYYVRTDGGDDTECTGLSNAPYPGSGQGQACAFDHPFRAFPPGGTPKLNGGDNLIIASGSYQMGLNAPGADMCSRDYPWDCTMPAVPSGPSTDKPTRILGEGWDKGCANPPELWGTQRATQIINLADSNNVEIACLNITDHEGCVEQHSGNIACERDVFPYGKWAVNGIYAEDSSDVMLKDLNVHGFANTGILAGRLHNWDIENVRIAGNGWAGWNGDIDGDDSNTGTMHFKHWIIEWNGCGETYPGLQPTGCWAQTAGGYGDGVGTGETAGNWVIEDSKFYHNTSDGLDLLYTRLPGATVTIRNSMAEGNAGNQFKTSGPTTIENSVAVGNCAYFEDKPFTYNVDPCRAVGNAISISAEHGTLITLTNNTIYSEGDCDIIVEEAQNPTTVVSRNNIFYGGANYLQQGAQSCLIWSDHPTTDEPNSPNRITFDNDYSIIYNVKDEENVCPIGSHDKCVDPMFNKVAKDSFDFSLKSGSPAINAGLASVAPKTDVKGKARDAKPDIGAYEY